MNDFNSSLPNIQFFNVCHYLSTFSIFFASIDLMTIDDRNQSMPVINALFEYLVKSPNESEAKNQLLQKVFIEFNTTGQENRRNDMKYVNETYQYIISSLFNHENFPAYLNRMNQTQNVKSSSQKLLKRFQNLLENHIRNVSSTRNGCTKLSPLAIGKKFYDYDFPSIQRTGISRGENKLALKRFRRMSPEDIHINNTNQTETLRTLELLLDEAVPVQTDGELGPEGLDNFDDWVNFVNSDEGNEAEFFHDTSNGLDDIGLLEHEKEFHDIPPNREADDGSYNFEDLLNFANSDDGNGAEVFNSILEVVDESEFLDNERELNDLPPVVDNTSGNFGDLSNSHNSNEGNELEFDNNTLNDADGVGPLVNEELDSPESQIQESFESRETLQENPGVLIITPKKHKFSHDTNIPLKVQRMDNQNDNSLINSNPAGADPILSDKPGTSKKARASINYVHQKITNNNSKSKRLQSIENAAKFLSSCVSYMTFNNAVNMLKGFLLKLEKSTTSVPTYDDYADDYCHNSEALANYDIWRIPNHKFIDDVLFETYFKKNITFNKLKMKMDPITFSSKKVVINDFEIYTNTPILQQSLRVEDFFLLKLTLQNELNIRLNETKKWLKAALYRLALRECEEEWVENNISLFGVQNEQWIQKLKYNKNNYTFIHWIEFSKDLEKEESKLVGHSYGKKKLLEYEIKFKNLAGIVSVDRIFGGNTTERFVMPFDTTLPIISSKSKLVGNKTIHVFKMQDNRSKEEKMIDMVTKLYDILTDSSDNFSAHYN